MGNAASSLKQMRVIHIAFIVAIGLYAYTAELVVGHPNSGAGSGLSAPVLYGITVGAGFDVLIAYYFRRTKLVPASERLRLDPGDPEALKQWRASTIVSLVLALSVGLYAFVLRFLGAPRIVSAPFYAGALILLLIWRPNLELGPEAPGEPRNH
jgi:hypothetical protein